ncbi:MAG: NAD(P)H-dependent oxidoreductase [candidate division SR1 bacterium]|nr:NAD(P)H-dependent oxidoreductase [candidate division SR1 bacterium]
MITKDILNFRTSIKSFDTTKFLTVDQVQNIKDSLRLAPSSYGLQPWSFIEVNDKEKRLELQKAGWGQSQFVDAPLLIVFAVPTDIKENTSKYVEEYMSDMVKVRSVERSSLDGFAQQIIGTIERLTHEEAIAWAQKQAYIALGFGLLTTASLGIDACPIEGFMPDTVDKILGLTEKNLKSTVVLAIGYRLASDHHADLPKVRKSEEKAFLAI